MTYVTPSYHLAAFSLTYSGSGPSNSRKALAECCIALLESIFHAMFDAWSGGIRAPSARCGRAHRFPRRCVEGASTHQLEAKIDQPLVGRQQMRIDQAHAVGQPHHLGFELVGRYRLQRKADRAGIRAGYTVAGQQQPLRPLWSAVIQPHAARRRAQIAHRRKADPRVVGDDDHVAQPGEIGADADAGAVHLRDHRLVHVEQRDPQALTLFQPPHVVVDLLPATIILAAAGRIFAEIGAGAEMRTGAAQHDTVHRVVFVGLQQRFVQLAQQPAR